MNDDVPFELPDAPERVFKGVWIPAAIWEHPTLTWTEKCLLGEIDSLSRGGFCWASNAFLAKRMKLKAGTVANALTRLTRAKLILHLDNSANKRQIVLAQNVQSNPQITLHFKVKDPSFKSEAPLHVKVNRENKRDTNETLSSAPEVPNGTHGASERFCPSEETAKEYLESQDWEWPNVELDICASKWFANMGHRELRDWRSHLRKFAEKWQRDAVGG